MLPHLAVGTKESYEHCLDSLRNMAGRELRVVRTVTTEGAPGPLRTVEEIFPESVRIRCWAHKMRNVLDQESAADGDQDVSGEDVCDPPILRAGR